MPFQQQTFSSINAGDELFTCYKASTSACSESDLEDRLIRWGFPSPQPQASQGDPVHHAQCSIIIITPAVHAEQWIHGLQVNAHREPVRTGNGANVQTVADRLYDPDVYHLSSQQSSQLSSKLLDLVHSTPWHPLARKHLTTASAQAVQARGVMRGKPSHHASAETRASCCCVTLSRAV